MGITFTAYCFAIKVVVEAID